MKSRNFNTTEKKNFLSTRKTLKNRGDVSTDVKRLKQSDIRCLSDVEDMID
jgi:hypothetical protein